ncbi:hypothetical protein H696_04097 [Fonticula alba]|uniref:Uncharacterized protein n=1 Tax=Fonticula alba TaxID=691883 RepID=A0A058Z5Z2_FONAL|nr:hypothetical protein H696_04097 [Fonticula alba]KCV69690.1 hypothetical protein H696_04097 [Fonticula alba]|eukprot:XP_009496255.1 hypothetical protein H696_04097 [Fonticula alba]
MTADLRDSRLVALHRLWLSRPQHHHPAHARGHVVCSGAPAPVGRLDALPLPEYPSASVAAAAGQDPNPAEPPLWLQTLFQLHTAQALPQLSSKPAPGFVPPAGEEDAITATERQARWGTHPLHLAEHIGRLLRAKPPPGPDAFARLLSARLLCLERAGLQAEALAEAEAFLQQAEEPDVAEETAIEAAEVLTTTWVPFHLRLLHALAPACVSSTPSSPAPPPSDFVQRHTEATRRLGRLLAHCRAIVRLLADAEAAKAPAAPKSLPLQQAASPGTGTADAAAAAKPMLHHLTPEDARIGLDLWRSRMRACVLTLCGLLATTLPPSAIHDGEPYTALYAPPGADSAPATPSRSAPAAGLPGRASVSSANVPAAGDQTAAHDHSVLRASPAVAARAAAGFHSLQGLLSPSRAVDLLRALPDDMFPRAMVARDPSGPGALALEQLLCMVQAAKLLTRNGNLAAAGALLAHGTELLATARAAAPCSGGPDTPDILFAACSLDLARASLWLVSRPPSEAQQVLLSTVIRLLRARAEPCPSGMDSGNLAPHPEVASEQAAFSWHQHRLAVGQLLQDCLLTLLATAPTNGQALSVIAIVEGIILPAKFSRAVHTLSEQSASSPAVQELLAMINSPAADGTPLLPPDERIATSLLSLLDLVGFPLSRKISILANILVAGHFF